MSDDSVLMNFSNALADAVEKAGASTVLVAARPRFPASGVAYDAQTILTANHVVEREEDITVVLPDGSEIPAALVGRDPGSDLALLKLSSARAVAAVPAGQAARVGQLVLALGRPTPEGIQASQGIVSMVGGPVRTGRASLLEGYIRTDATPYPGFSGGPLVNLQGQVLGINTSGFMPGASLTIPQALAWKTAEALRNFGRVKRGYLGVRTQVVELPEALQEKLHRKQASGLLLVGVEAGSAAEEAGLMVGDILAGLEGRPVEDHDALVSQLTGDNVGRALAVEVIRGGEVRSLAVRVGEKA